MLIFGENITSEMPSPLNSKATSNAKEEPIYMYAKTQKTIWVLRA